MPSETGQNSVPVVVVTVYNPRGAVVRCFRVNAPRGGTVGFRYLKQAVTDGAP